MNWSIFLSFSLVALGVGIPLQLLLLPLDRRRRFLAWVTRWVWSIGMIGAQPLWRRWITGRERLAGLGPHLLVANHQSMLDIPLLLHLEDLRVVARPGVFRLPGIGLGARLGGHIRVDPDDPASLAAARDAIRMWTANGTSVAMFPEGTRGEGHAIAPFHRGAFQLAADLGLAVVPVAILGSADALPKGSPLPRRWLAHMHVAVLPPIHVPGPATPALRRQLAQQARGAIVAASARPRPWELVARVATRYRPQGRFREGWARGKLSGDPIYGMLQERVPTSGRLLDLGAGEGLAAAWLLDAGHTLQIEGWDLDEGRLEVARRAVPEAELHARDARRVDPTAGVDVITIIDVLHYLTPEDQAGLLSRACAALAPGGWLWLRDPGRDGGIAAWSERLLVATGRHQTTRGSRVRAMGERWLVAQLERSLEGIVVCPGSPGTPFGNVLIGGRKPISAR